MSDKNYHTGIGELRVESQKELNTLDDYEKMREQLIAWRKHQIAMIWEKYDKDADALLHAAWERGIYERGDDGVFVPCGDDPDGIEGTWDYDRPLASGETEIITISGTCSLCGTEQENDMIGFPAGVKTCIGCGNLLIIVPHFVDSRVKDE